MRKVFGGALAAIVMVIPIVFAGAGAASASDEYIETKLIPVQASPTSRVGESTFGRALDFEGDTVVAGSPDANGRRGRAYVFERGADGLWIETAELVPPLEINAVGDEFGKSVATNGTGTIVVGAPGASVPGSDSSDGFGLAFVFHDNGDGTYGAPATIETPPGVSFFGQQVAIEGDVIYVADGKNVNVYTPSEGGGYDATVIELQPVAEGGLILGINGIAVDNGIIVATVDNSFGNETYTLTRTDDGGYDQALLFSALAADFSGNVVSLGLSDGTTVAGLPAGSSDGTVLAIEAGTQSVIKPDGSVLPGTTPLGDDFGRMVDIDNGIIVVGDPRDSEGAEKSGAAYVFHPDCKGGYNQTKLLPGQSTQSEQGTTWPASTSLVWEDQNYGGAVAIDDGTIIVAAPGDPETDSGQGPERGSLFAYEPVNTPEPCKPGPETTTTTTAVPTTTTAVPTTTTTKKSTTTTQPGTTITTEHPTTTTTEPSGDQLAVVEFVSVADGDVVPRKIPYGGINVVAYDPDAGSNDGDGIRLVKLVLSDAETGRFLGVAREYHSTYDFGLRLRRGRSYVLTAYAVSEAKAGGGWSETSITVTAEKSKQSRKTKSPKGG